MDEGCRLKCVIAPLVAKIGRRHTMQLVVDEWQHSREGLLIAVARFREETMELRVVRALGQGLVHVLCVENRPRQPGSAGGLQTKRIECSYGAARRKPVGLERGV